MRPVICKCPNHTGCLLAYHGDDIEIDPSSPMLCPECGTPLKTAPKPKSDAFYHMVNLLGGAALALGVWYAWPTIKQLWYKAITPPAKTAPARR